MGVQQAEDMQAKIEELQKEIYEKKQALAALRRQAPKEPVGEYAFQSLQGSKKLSDLFGDKSELIIIHNMGKGCAMCTTWADGFNGVAHHLSDRAAFVVSSPDDPATQAAFAASRGWTFPMVSTQGTTFAKEMGYTWKHKDGTEGPAPGASVFQRDDQGRVVRVAHTGFGPGDNYCVIWDFLDLLPVDREWWPKFKY